jgi:hypothetical protein
MPPSTQPLPYPQPGQPRPMGLVDVIQWRTKHGHVKAAIQTTESGESWRCRQILQGEGLTRMWEKTPGEANGAQSDPGVDDGLSDVGHDADTTTGWRQGVSLNVLPPTC